MKLEEFLEKNNENYDFKNESPTDKVKNEEDPIKKFLLYHLDYAKTGFDCDCCELAKEMYKKLWSLNDKELKSYDCDTMNSFSRLYRLLLKSYDDVYWKKTEISHPPTRSKWLLKDEVYEHYKVINENESVKEFARLTHTLGNFTLLPKGFNVKRNILHHDYWDLTLQYFNVFLGDNAFVPFVEKYYYKNYLDEEKVELYWEGHSLNQIALPRDLSYGQIIEIIEKMNGKIKARGKEILEELK